MQIIINGKAMEFQEGVTLLEVITSLGLEDRVMAAACNMQIVKKEQWSKTRLKEGDKLELLDFVGGG